MSRKTSVILAVCGVLIVGMPSCTSSLQGDGHNASAATPEGIPELTQEIINERINDARVYDVLPESGTGNPIPWGFDEDEPKEIVVVDKSVEGSRATIVLDIKTQSSPRSNNLRYLYGQIRTKWELRTGWVLRRWEIDEVENISMKYRDIPKPNNSNTNTNGNTNQSTPNKTSIVN